MLRRLWSPTGLIDAIPFHPGLNLIIGRYSGDRRQRGINGIGKSSAVRLIDFALLSDSAERRFAEGKYAFLREGGHQIALELEVRGQSLQIRRDFADSQTVYIRRGSESEFRYRKDEASRLLGGMFFPEAEDRQLPGERYRSLMQFFVKDDLATQARKDPVAFVTHGGANKQELMALNLFLMGLPNRALISFGERKDVLSGLQRERGAVVDRVERFAGKRLAELKTEAASREKDLEGLRASLKEFALLEDFRRVSDTVGELEIQISRLRQAVDRTDRQLVKLRRFTSTSHEVDVAEVAEQYRLVSETLGSAVRRSLEEVIAFRESLAQARLRFHGKQLRAMESERAATFQELARLEERRASLLRGIEDSVDSATSMSEAFERYAAAKVELERVTQAISDVADLDGRIADARFGADAMRRDAVRAISAAEDVIREIRDLFVEVVDKAIGFTTQGEREGAYLDVNARPAGGMKQVPVDIVVEVPRADALGYARLRLVAYDLTVFLHAVITQVPVPRFLIHDGAFHGIAKRTVVRALNYVYHWSLQHPTFQYIATFNEDELSVTPDEQVRDGQFAFDIEKQTVLTVADSADRMLFRRQFD